MILFLNAAGAAVVSSRSALHLQRDPCFPWQTPALSSVLTQATGDIVLGNGHYIFPVICYLNQQLQLTKM